MSPEAALDAILSDLGGSPRAPLGLAVSGGGDSAALLQAAGLRHRRDGTAFRVATVDHGLRPGSDGEARAVADASAALGLPHDTLRWEGWDGRGNLQQAAREARRGLLAAWAQAAGMRDVLLAHTADDQAETVLLRLARGSGVDGLAGMKGSVIVGGVVFRRPFLRLGREDLRAWLRDQGVGWIEDPSNDDPRFDRVRARAMMGQLARLGLTRERLLRTAEHMRAAQVTLDLAAVEEARRVARFEDGCVVLPLALIAGVGRSDASSRLLAAALMWVGGRDRRPRWESLRRLAVTVAAGRTATLAGCRVSPEGEAARIAPEPGREPGRARPRGGAFEFVTFTGAAEAEG